MSEQTARGRLDSSVRRGAPVTTTSWVVWAAAAVVMAPSYIVVHELLPDPSWWAAALLSLAAIASAGAGNLAGRAWMTRRPEPRGPETLRDATTMALLACALATDGAWSEVAPRWVRTALIIAWFVFLAVGCAVYLVRRRSTR